MGSEYDRKFEEMKKYIPFLESMIERLETTSSPLNPRQAQLDKIRSLRDLLLNKKKRMKMDNLLKCEQVLINLYAKIEHKDTSSAVKTENMNFPKDNSELEAVRNKLKTVAKIQNVTETLPEIARASEIEEICEPGSKEPALFQRRPNRSLSPARRSPKKSQEIKIFPKPQSKRNYTRVLVSPDRRTSRWPANEETSVEKPLFSRRSPRRSPRRNSPPYHKKEKKKPSKDRKSKKNLNITLNVPEDSLDSLNTDDILSRIINCSDGDVDIATLRELRSQILGELKQTGTNDDISELILKSYNNKSKTNKKKNKSEVEEGEISDSESEVIDNVYGSLMVMDKDKKHGQVENETEKNNQQRKIQICFVINADKQSGNQPVPKNDLSESGVFESNSSNVICLDSDSSPSPKKKESLKNNAKTDDAVTKNDKDEPSKAITTETSESIVSGLSAENDSVSSTQNKDSLIESQTTPTKILYSPSKILQSPSPVKLQPENKSNEPTNNIANFYKPHPEDDDKTQHDTGTDSSIPTNKSLNSKNPNNTTMKDNDSTEKNTDDSTQIPLLNEPTLPPKAKKVDVLSEIDILQALKNEILSETIIKAPTEVDTPALHQPKITKVASASEVSTSTLQTKTAEVIPNSRSSGGMPKKRISIENYKKKSETVAKSLFVKKRSNATREEMKKQSLKLTEKECERFNFPARLSLDDDTDDISDDDLLDDDKPVPMVDIYGDLAPKSPDQEDFTDNRDEAPVIIPVDPVKSPVIASKTDVDLRSTSNTPQIVPPPTGFVNVVPSLRIDNLKNVVFEPNKAVSDGVGKPLVDPRLRRENQPASQDSPNPYGATNVEGTPRPSQFPNIPPLMGPIFTPSYTPSMTPIRTPNARSFEMTPSHQAFEIEESQQKHIYAPSFSMCDNRDLSVAKEKPIWELNKPSKSNDDHRRRDTRNSRWESSKGGSTQLDTQPNYNPRNDTFFIDRRDVYSKSDCPSTPGPSFGWTDRAADRPVLLETPMTPSHPFGRSDCPPTPTHHFGRLDCPPTPSHPFGRSDCPSTPSHPFGRSDCPPTPSHPFGRSECPLNPSHSFGASECPPTPNHPFGRSDFKDPRINRRQAEYESYHNDRGYKRSNSYKSHNRPYVESDSPRYYDREQHYGRSDRFPNEHNSRFSNESSERCFDQARREPSLSSYFTREDSSRLFSRNRDGRYDNRYSDNNEEIGYRRNQRERSIGRSMSGDKVRGREPSVDRSKLDHSLSVKPQAGRSFTIDTSVNSTFQDLIKSGKGIQLFDYTFDARRQRAASVGRSLVRESSVGRILTHEIKSKGAQSTDSSILKRRRNFERASSVGRVLVSEKNERSFQEIKDDFKSYSLNSSKNISDFVKKKEKKENTDANKAASESNSTIIKEDFHRSSKHNVKPYSPRKNNRDPRMRTDQKDLRNNRNDRDSHSLDRRQPGISYSNDNIAKGTIMGTGFGVKNYKIPKIKRPEPEPPKTPIVNVVKENEKVKVSSPKTEADKKNKSNDKKEKTKSSDDEIHQKIKSFTSKTQSGKKLLGEKLIEKKDKDNLLDDSTKSKIKVTKQKESKTANISDDDSEKRITRSSKKSNSYLKEEPIKKSKRIRKTIIDDSDSDDETDLKTVIEKNKYKSKPTKIEESNMSTKQKIKEASKMIQQADVQEDSTKKTSNSEPDKSKQKLASGKSTAEKELRKTLEEDSLDSSFGIDDLEMFSDNIVSDPVIDGINDLIADLDHDLGAPKSANDNFASEMEKIIGAIDSQEENTLGDISELIEKDLNESNKKLKEVPTQDDDSELNEIELITGPRNSANPIVAAVVNREREKSNDESPSQNTGPTTVRAKNISISVTTETKQIKDPKVQISEENETNNGHQANSDAIVSTTQIEQSNMNKHMSDIDIEKKADAKISTSDQSAPDSTIEQNDEESDKSQESLPDSTMEIHSEISSDVTSTLNDADKSLKESAEPSQSRKEVSAIESFGSLLSILQDKSKIKELLSMLGEQSGESEKIKKKLEKLSEIVSDEEDAIDNQTVETTKSDKALPDGLSQIDAEKTNEKLNESIEPGTEMIIDKIDKELTDEESNKEKLVKDVLSDNKNDSKCEYKKEGLKQALIPEENKAVKSLTSEENKGVKSNENRTDISQTSDQTQNDPNDDLESNENQDKDIPKKMVKRVIKKTKVAKKSKGKGRRGKANPKLVKPVGVKSEQMKPKPKKSRNRELSSLQNDIKEMFMCDDVLNATGIRMCRLAKMVDKKQVCDSPPKDHEPMMLLQKYKDKESLEEPIKKIRKKPGPKPKPKLLTDPKLETTVKKDSAMGYKPGPKSKTKQKQEADPYEFDTDSVADTNTTKESDSSDSDSESLSSSASFGSSEVLADIKKKPKKKRGSWKSGIIKPRHKKKKDHDSLTNTPEVPLKPVTIPDWNCFTDKTYCFQRGLFSYDCRLCHYSGTEIVNHYKKQHAHTEVPLSRMDPYTAKKAIKQCEQINFQAISKIPSEKYTCRFCYKEFSKNRVALETFFWHVVSTHTGEYKHLCYECVNVTRCPFNLDIPPPPKEVKGQLIGYICGKCNFTQISLENLKTHVIVRHNDEQTEVYTINLGAMTQKAMKSMLRKSLTNTMLENQPRTLRSSRSNQSVVEASDERSDVTSIGRLSEVGSAIPKIEEPDPHLDAALAEVKRSKPGPLRSKIRFEADDQERSDETSVKVETEPEIEYPTETSQLDDTYDETAPLNETNNDTPELDTTVHLSDVFNDSSVNHTLNTTVDTDSTPSRNDLEASRNEVPEPRRTTDVFEKPHFKLSYKESGAKEYVCCVNGVEHYKTTLLISLKKHVQIKHSENWDGYCCVCKVIVTLQGVQSKFKECLTHFLDKHMDDFPVLDKVVDINEDSRSSLRSSIDAPVERTESPRTYIAVRPLSDLISKDLDADPPMCEDSITPLPVIENVVSLGDKIVEIPQTSTVYPTTSTKIVSQLRKPFQYEEIQAVVMSQKHKIVLDTMMPKQVLVRVYKCAGRFCSFTSDSAEDSLLHASAHKQLGGEGALDCAYCNFDAAGNAIDLVMHVFKEHGRCQFSCMLCFYRAAADQLVGAHLTKAHGTAGETAKVLRTTAVLNSAVADSTNMLSREIAVQYYICSHGGGSCKFRTYTPGKYCEHLQQKHGSEKSHPCNLCRVTSPTATELVKHMKDHGLKLYQCTWCVHGANTESDMLSHAASMHPTKNPQAYLRIITNKDGSTDLRVLPLIYLNKLKVPIEDVIPSKVKENPTREAERSIELEKLIRHTSLTLETNLIPESTVSETLQVPEAPVETIAVASDLTDEQTIQAIEMSLLTSPQKAPQNVKASTMKDEPQEILCPNQKTEHFVYCLDSDDEEATTVNKVTKEATKPAVIDLSDDETDKSGLDTPVLKQLISEPPKASDKLRFKKLPPVALFKCPSCVQNFRNVASFKKHMNSCSVMSTISCPHSPCPIVLTNVTQLINHYNKDHNVLNIRKMYYCGVCKSKWLTLYLTKKHLKESHGAVKVVVTSQLDDDGTCILTVNKETRAADRPKRKASVETPKKYGIEDIDKLPINPILDSLVYCNICEFSTKVRLNMVRHLQLHAERQPVPQTAPVNPVPHLETNEKHFDKMVNLASSSAATRAEKPPSVAPEVVARYPKYVPDRQRHTCGAKGCSYISVDESMLRCHWETLHSAAVDYHCAHCPPHQHLDTSKSLTASRIIAHLKMHDTNLYACSSCPYYHHKKQIVEKHITEVHKDKAHVQTVREEGTNPMAQAPAAVGTMDLKPWQCGLCQFKSMLRRDLIEHCSNHHQTKMQYKCAYCPFRTSDIENIVKHQSNAHPTKAEDVFYYYYREGDVPNEPDGTPRWQRQCQQVGVQATEVKSEVETEPIPASQTAPVDLNLVKKEVEDTEEMSMDDLCKMYGQFCDPNGISYRCSLCKTVMEYTREAMQSHLYEELNYRRWNCAICNYKAYHRVGLNEHMASEHNRNFVEPSELPVNHNIEKWVSKLLDHQSAIIDRNKINAQPSTVTEKPVAGPSKVVEPTKVVEPPKPVSSSDSELELAFGSLGSPKDDSYCCPKCKITIKDEDEMRDHLESELTKIRWCCTKCTDKFPTFHQAQFHCKGHPGPLSRPKEAIRDPSLRSAWVTAVITTQKTSMKPDPTQQPDETEDEENSLLVVRYEEAAPTEEQLLQIAREDQLREARKRTAEPDSDDDDDDDGMVICEPDSKKINNRNCPFCDFVSRSNHQYKVCMREHILRHYNLKVLTCEYCPYNGSRKTMYQHLQTEHPGLPHLWKQTSIPNVLPSEYNLKNRKCDKKSEKGSEDEKYKICLHCEASVPEHELITHLHGNNPSEFGEKGEVVVKCCICLTLRSTLQTMQAHYNEAHPDIPNLNYAYYKLQIDTREVQSCGICNRRFTFLRDLRIHHSTMHGSFHFTYKTVPYRPDEDDHANRGKRKLSDPVPPSAKRIAKKSTAKPPYTKAIAKKSTTKLPYVESDSEVEFSYYGTRPPSFKQYENVMTVMPVCNTMVEIDVKKLSGILKIDPKVVVKDCRQHDT